MCLFFYLGFSFCSRSFSNNAARHDLPNRHSVQSVSQSINIERLGNMGFTTISLSSNVKNSLAVQHGILCNNLL